MSMIRCVYSDAPPEFPATDQHPDAERYGPIACPEGVVFVDAIGGCPSLAEISAVLTPPEPVPLTPQQKLAAAGLSVSELRELLNLG